MQQTTKSKQRSLWSWNPKIAIILSFTTQKSWFTAIKNPNVFLLKEIIIWNTENCVNIRSAESKNMSQKKYEMISKSDYIEANFHSLDDNCQCHIMRKEEKNKNIIFTSWWNCIVLNLKLIFFYLNEFA